MRKYHKKDYITILLLCVLIFVFLNFDTIVYVMHKGDYQEIAKERILEEADGLFEIIFKATVLDENGQRSDTGRIQPLHTIEKDVSYTVYENINEPREIIITTDTWNSRINICLAIIALANLLIFIISFIEERDDACRIELDPQ